MYPAGERAGVDVSLNLVEEPSQALGPRGWGNRRGLDERVRVELGAELGEDGRDVVQTTSVIDIANEVEGGRLPC